MDKIYIILTITLLPIGLFLYYTFVVSVKCSKCKKEYDFLDVKYCRSCGTKNKRYLFTMLAQSYYVVWTALFLIGGVVYLIKKIFY